MGKLTIHRKEYTRKGGVRVKASTYKTADRGKKGRTPKSQQWYKAKVHTGWKKTQNPSYRRKLVLHSCGGSYYKAGKKMLGLANVTTDKQTEIKARADYKFFYSKNK